MKKFLTITVLFVISSALCFADSISYVYGTSISSLDTESPSKGSCYTDNKNNIYRVSNTRYGVTEFEIVTTRGPVEKGSELIKRRPLIFTGLTAGIKKFSLNADITAFIHPLSFMIDSDVSFNLDSIAVFAGIRANVPLSVVTSAESTFIEDGSLYAYALFGSEVKNNLSFMTKWGLGYRHIIKRFFWSLGYDETLNVSAGKKISDFALSLGVMI